MGTTYSVKLAAPETSSPEQAVIAQADRRRARARQPIDVDLDPRLRALALQSASSPRTPSSVSPETFEVFEIAEQVSEQSEGAFDITVGPLVAAWGFGATDRPPQPPSVAELAELEDWIGWQRITLDREAQTISKAHSRTQCDLSAIAKGYAVDRVADALLARGQKDFLVEIGGELRARGTKLDGSKWRIGIERSSTGDRLTHLVLAVGDRALATSGDYRNFYEEQGERISHTIDPRQRRPIRHSLASVSVLHESATWADALATALTVMGPEQGVAWAEQRGLAALFLVRDEDAGFREVATPAFRELRADAEVAAAGR